MRRHIGRRSRRQRTTEGTNFYRIQAVLRSNRIEILKISFFHRNGSVEIPVYSQLSMSKCENQVHNFVEGSMAAEVLIMVLFHCIEGWHIHWRSIRWDVKIELGIWREKSIPCSKARWLFMVQWTTRTLLITSFSLWAKSTIKDMPSTVEVGKQIDYVNTNKQTIMPLINQQIRKLAYQ